MVLELPMILMVLELPMILMVLELPMIEEHLHPGLSFKTSVLILNLP
jgi:hypothetical protein